VLINRRPRAPIVIAVLVGALLVSGCSLFGRKKAQDTTYAETPVDQLYAAGAVKLDHHQWSDGVTYFKEVERQHPYSEWSRRAIIMQAYAHYEANQYDDAIADSNRFIELYPGNSSTPYAYYLKAECFFEQILDVGRDQAATEQALVAMREVNRRYPSTEYAQDARLKIDMINDQLAGKEMSIGRWYLRQGATLSAIGRFKTVIDRYQTTSDAPEALYRLVEAYLTLGLIEEAKRNAAVLGYNFPGDVWYADAYRLMTERGYQPAVTPKAKKGGFFQHAAEVLSFGAVKGSAPPPPDQPLPANPVVQTQPSAGDTSSAPASAPQKKGGGMFDWLPFGHKPAASPASPAPPSS
jgi:outer membrane protein assembly factor BamD